MLVLFDSIIDSYSDVFNHFHFIYSSLVSQLYHKLGLKDKVQYALQLAFDTCSVVKDYEGSISYCVQ